MPVGVLIGVSAASAVSSQKQARKAQRAQEKAQKIDVKRQDFQMAREKRKQIRQARVARAQIQATSFAQGTAGTSKTAAITGGISSERAQNLSFLDTSAGFVSAIGKQNLLSSRAMAKASRIKAYGQVVTSSIAAGQAGGLFDGQTGGVTGLETNRPDFI
jgi:hypothetical protein